MAFTRLPTTVKMLTTCCDDCGAGIEVQWLPQKVVAASGVSVPTHREAETELDVWEAGHQCEPASVSLAAV